MKNIKVRSKSIILGAFCLILFFNCACSKNSGGTTTPPATDSFAKGADISWVTEMESNGLKFYNAGGTQTDCFGLMQSLGMNTVRFRVWVNPSSSWNNAADVVAKAARAKALGLRVMIDFHYSDTWADPGNQTKPVAWASQDFTTLKASVSSHTSGVLNQLKTAGVTPEWVQVGNETNNGMLWPDGKATNSMANFAQLINAGYDAVKSVFPNAKVIVHVSNGFDNSLFQWMFDGLTANGAKYDVIGMSLYPGITSWQSYNVQCLSNMNNMVAKYNKKVMVVEVGMSWTAPADCKAFIADLITKTKSVTGGNGIGVLYWEPEAYNNWNGYQLGAFDNSGKPTTALDAFK